MLSAVKILWHWEPYVVCQAVAVAVLMDEAGVGFIVGARTTRAPGDLEAQFHWAGDAFTDGQVIDTITPQEGLAERAGQESQGRAGVGPGHSPGFVEVGVVLLQAPRGLGQPDPHSSGQPGPGCHRRREAP